MTVAFLLSCYNIHGDAKKNMFFRLVYKRNYAYLLLIGGGIALLSQLIIGKTFTGVVFSLGFYYLSILQLQSGIALDRSWTAEYKKEEHPFIFYTVILFGFLLGSLGLVMLFGS